ncbi:MAG: hypothetical protein ACTHLN_05795 [Tepidisphaeraceae bacterium]
MQVFDLDELQAKSRPPRAKEASVKKSKAWLYLNEADRTLLEMVEKGLPHRLIGQALGLNAGTVSRRLAMIRTRLHSPLARCALDPRCPLSSEARLIALMHTLGGQPVRHIARLQHLTPAAVNEHLTYARGVARGVAAR